MTPATHLPRRDSPARLGLTAYLIAIALGAVACADDDFDVEADTADIGIAGDPDAGSGGATPDSAPSGAGDVSSPDASGVDAEVRPPCESECYDNPVWDLRIGAWDWDALHADVFADVDVDAILVVDGVEYEVEVELQGSSSRTFDKRNFKLRFDDDAPMIPDPFDLGEELTYDKLIIKAAYKDQSFMREPLAWELLRSIGLPAPRTSWINLRINGEYWGLYVLTEPLDRDYLRRRDFEDGGNLYKAIDKSATLAPGMRLEVAFEKRTNDDTPWTDLEAFVRLIQQVPATEEDFYAEIDPVWPLAPTMDRMIWVAYTQNLDTWRQNFYLYNEGTVEAPDWTLLSWDSDIAFSQHWRLDRDIYEVEWSHMLDGNTFFGRRLMSIDTVRRAYVERFEEMLDTLYAPEVVLPIAESFYERVRRDAARDLVYWSRSSTPEEEFGEIEAFIRTRPDYLRRELEAFYDDPDIPDYLE